MMAGTNILAYFSKKKSFMTFAKKILAGVNTLAYLTKKESLMTFGTSSSARTLTTPVWKKP
jgi:hypothetical protein